MEVCAKIYDDWKVDLIDAIYIERELLKAELKKAQDSACINRLITRLEGKLIEFGSNNIVKYQQTHYAFRR